MQPGRIDGVAKIVAAAVFLTVVALGLNQLYRSHPAEDAFILFRYAENVAAGDGIVYCPGGPPTEGATDFLWMMMLAANVRAGVDVALAALFWNAVGAGVSAALIARDTRTFVSRGPWRVLLLVLPLSIPFVAGAPAAYLGFSSLAYQGLMIGAFVVVSEALGAGLASVPWLGLALALFRPDGALLAAGFTLAGALRAWRGGRWRTYLVSAAGAVAAGIVYFLGRWRYFGLPLPLPLYVKSHGVLHGPVADRILAYLPWMKGIGVQLMWLKSGLGPVPLAVALALLLALSFRGGRVDRRWRRQAATAALAGTFLLGALSFAFQVQNVHFRYQAPVTALLLFLVAGLGARRIAAARTAATRAAIVAVLGLGLAPSLCAGAAALLSAAAGRSYIDGLPVRLDRVLGPERTIALTDAGRLGYWAHRRTIDVAGLNYAPTALRPPSVELLRAIDPDVLLLHPGAAVSGEAFVPPSGSPPFWEIDRDRIERQIAPALRSAFENGIESYGPDSNTATVAALVMLRYLAERDGDYVTLAVRYQGGYRHVLAFRRSLPEAAAIRAALEQATSGKAYASYAALKGFWGARLVDADVDRSEH